jgi:tetraacyldisaccharide 4'-kinase
MRLKRDLDLVLMDAAKPFGNGHLLPRGTLREPIESLARADAVLLTRCPRRAFIKPSREGLESRRDRIALRPVRPVFLAAHRPFVTGRFQDGQSMSNGIVSPDTFESNGPVFAFSGIARNREFRMSLQEMGFCLKGWQSFADHHAYTLDDVKALVGQARKCGARLLATTEKDRVKIDPAWVRALPLIEIGVGIDMGHYADAFERFVLRHLACGNGS